MLEETNWGHFSDYVTSFYRDWSETDLGYIRHSKWVSVEVWNKNNDTFQLGARTCQKRCWNDQIVGRSEVYPTIQWNRIAFWKRISVSESNSQTVVSLFRTVTLIGAALYIAHPRGRGALSNIEVKSNMNVFTVFGSSIRTFIFW